MNVLLSRVADKSGLLLDQSDQARGADGGHLLGICIEATVLIFGDCVGRFLQPAVYPCRLVE